MFPFTLTFRTTLSKVCPFCVREIAENNASGEIEMFERFNTVQDFDEILIFLSYRNSFHLTKVAKYEIITRMLGQSFRQPPLATVGAIHILPQAR